MNPADQELLYGLWQDFLGEREPNNNLFREFYLEVVKEMDSYAYGMASELFDLLINGMFDETAASSWNGFVATEQVEAA